MDDICQSTLTGLRTSSNRCLGLLPETDMVRRPAFLCYAHLADHSHCSSAVYSSTLLMRRICCPKRRRANDQADVRPPTPHHLQTCLSFIQRIFVIVVFLSSCTARQQTPKRPSTQQGAIHPAIQHQLAFRQCRPGLNYPASSNPSQSRTSEKGRLIANRSCLSLCPWRYAIWYIDHSSMITFSAQTHEVGRYASQRKTRATPPAHPSFYQNRPPTH